MLEACGLWPVACDLSTCELRPLSSPRQQLSDPHAVDERALLSAARQTAETAPLLLWLRLLASACMRGDSQTFEHVVPEGVSLAAS